ncbi:Slowpoke-binding protein [Strongyloides ratti]|uniref:Slowpoke-binding protein n=1 Tax=Strongyloides ratti TaxID=34506 RepID=A0A090LB31_STRRB|nr:Slowpoke-binding protein [Strongyloides ratti]CEF65328.1 Slowpoke-binding protein [Strongyloides ratti]
MSLNSLLKEDITNPLDCRVEGWRIDNGHVKYLLSCRRRIYPVKKWYLQKRYSEFFQLNESLKGYHSYLKLPERLINLQSFINRIFSLPILYGNKNVWEFFGLEKGAIGDYKYWVLVLMRNQIKLYEDDSLFVECGWRGNKINYFYGNSKKGLKLLSWLPFGVDCWKNGKISNLSEVLEFISLLKIPFIYPVDSRWVDEKGIGCTRNVSSKGSLRDILWDVKKPLDNFLNKYGSQKKCTSLELNNIKIIGRQILESLIFLYSINYPFIDIHCEFTLCGHSSIHRAGMLRSNNVKTIQDMMVFSFGNCLYEMFGGGIFFPDKNPNDGYKNIPEEGLEIFKSIFNPTNNILPSLVELVNSKFFNTSEDKNFEDLNNIVIPKNIYITLEKLKASIENRLNEDREKLFHEEQIIQKDSFCFDQLINYSKNVPSHNDDDCKEKITNQSIPHDK